MRPVLTVDLICAGRAVLGVGTGNRHNRARELISAAEVADRFREEKGVCHPEFGDGTLAGAARLFGMAPEPAICNAEFSQALIHVLEALMGSNSTNHRSLQ